MEFREFAQHLLFGKTLSEKCLKPEILTDYNPGNEIKTPEYPGRPTPLKIDLSASKKRLAFPKTHQLEEDKNRGIILHFFANHELLALELMALVLLKFPKAPKSFRRGVIQTIKEEQKHMLLYLNQMQHLGVEFGEIPVNRFFWDTISKMKSPLDYVVQMSMTFEQANLDYALHYQKIFQQIGDAQTTEILKVVFEEEISHVKFGVNWFNRWRNSAESEWDSYQKELQFPLTPNRAKGIGFTEEARQRAGLSQDFIERLKVYHHSKGRPGSLFFFNPECELQIATQKPGFTASSNIQAMTEDFGAIMLFLSKNGDSLLCQKIPSTKYLEMLQNAGFQIPEFLKVTTLSKTKENLKHRKFTSFEPWGWSYDTRVFFQSLQSHLVKEYELKVLPDCFSKAWSRQLRINFMQQNPQWNSYWKTDFGFVCTTLAEVQNAILQQKKHSNLILKAIFSSSGQNRIKINAKEKLNTNEIRWIERTLAQQGKIIVEPWMQRICDIGLLLQVATKAKQPMRGYLSFLTTPQGQYIGHLLGDKFPHLPPNALQFIHGYGGKQAPLREIFEAITIFAEEALKDKGYQGPAGIDTYIYKTETNHYYLCPLSEINPRYTMGHIAFELERHLSPGVNGIWRHLNLKEIKKLGYENFEHFIQTVQKKFPLKMDNSNPPKLAEGVLFTNDPQQIKAVLGVLFIQKNSLPEQFFDQLKL